MSRDPYAPPGARLADPQEPRDVFPKPRQVRVAVALLWLSLALGFPSIYLQFGRADSPDERIVLLAFMVPLVALSAFLNLKISAGRNWARIAFLILVGLALLIFLLPDNRDAGAQGVEIALDVLTTALDLVAACLLFTRPGALWFRPPS